MKFRVWDAKLKRFCVPSDVAITSQGDILVYTQTGTMEWKWLRPLEHGRYTAQRFSGSQDKNKRDIYEGDIVNVNGSNREIVWRGSGFFCTWSDYGLDTCWFAGGAPVVMGNRFENPELL